MYQFNIFISYRLDSGKVINKLGCVLASDISYAYCKAYASMKCKYGDGVVLKVNEVGI